MAEKRKHRSALRRAVFVVLWIAFGFGVLVLLMHPRTPLPPWWNPVLPFAVSDPLTPLTGWKLRRALRSAEACNGVLASGDIGVRVLADFEKDDACHIRPRVALSRVGGATMSPLETRCETALRLAMWLHHGVQPAAMDVFGQPVTQVIHLSSYSCRRMRLTGGETGAMSTHATADSVDIAGVVIGGNRRITLLADWSGDGEEREFLRAIRNAACDWFGLVLGPDYNALHADHFHLQNRGWGLCR